VALALCIGIAIIGCRYGEQMVFATGGEKNNISTGDKDDDETVWDDTGAPADDTAGQGLGGEPPVLHDLDASVDEYPDIGWVVEVVASYSDADDDLDGGKVLVIAVLDGAEAEEQWISIDGSDARIDFDAGTVEFVLGGVTEETTVLLTVALKDQNLNMSNEMTVEAN
jgi:hypothetical protein